MASVPGILAPDHIRSHHFRDPLFRRFMVLSLGVHIVILVLAGTATLFRMPSTIAYSPAYTVDLVTLPPSPGKKTEAEPPLAPAPQQEKLKPALEKPVEKAALLPEPLVQPKNAEPPKPVIDAEELARAERRERIKDLSKEVTRIYERIGLNEAVSAPPPPAKSPTSGDEGSLSEAPAQKAGDPAPGSAGLNPADLRFKVYYDRIWARIKAAWVLPESVSARDEKMMTVVGIRISSTGVIEDMWIEKSSGNTFFDQSALRALSKASPLPPLPTEYRESSLDVGINFRVTE